jgi:transmembrane sensor
MQITTEQIHKFLTGGCTAAEAEVVAAFLRNNPEILNSYLQADWDSTSDEGQLPSEESREMYLQILQQLPLKKQPLFSVKKMGLVAAAALLLGVVLLSLPGKKQPVKEMARATLQPTPDSSAKTTWVIHYNESYQKEKIILPDSTTVVLAGKSQISYPPVFAANKREIKMQGQVYFDVHKNQSKPFTVYAGNTATTALGTSFCINMRKKDVTIKLFTGKVMIKPVHARAKGWDTAIYLVPGEQLQYDISTTSTTISLFNKKTANDESPQTTTALSFNNDPITTVLDKLSEKYKVSILYNKKEISGISFTGTVLPGDSLPVILNIIGKMNGFETDQENGAFIIKKTSVLK